MTERRFFVEPVDANPQHLRLGDDEARHAERVLRLGVGAKVTCFDGRGRAWRGTIESFDRHCATVGNLEPLEVAPEPSQAIHLVQAVIKNDAMDLVVQKATELGVASIVPLLAERCDVRRDADRAARRVERWRKIAREAAKQSERGTLPAIGEAVGLEDAIESAAGASVVLVERGGDPIADVLARIGDAGAVTLFVGPEGGWTNGERASFAREAVAAASLGRGVLRAETAAIAGVAVARSVLWK